MEDYKYVVRGGKELEYAHKVYFTNFLDDAQEMAKAMIEIESVNVVNIEENK